MSRRELYVHPAVLAAIDQALAGLRAIWAAPGVTDAQLTLVVRHRKLPGGELVISDNDNTGALAALKRSLKVEELV